MKVSWRIYFSVKTLSRKSPSWCGLKVEGMTVWCPACSLNLPVTSLVLRKERDRAELTVNLKNSSPSFWLSRFLSCIL